MTRTADRNATAVAQKQQGNCSSPEQPQPIDGIRCKLDGLWKEVGKMERNGRLVNTTLAADWVLLGEQALAKGQTANAKRCCVWAAHWLANAEKCARDSQWGYLAIAVELIYLLFALGVPIALIVRASLTNDMQNIQATLDTVTNFQVFQVPLFLLVWGFLGGVVWCLYSAAYWARARLFDKQYLVWHIAHPWVSAVLGAGVGFLIFAGLTGATGMNGDAKLDQAAPAFVATLAVVSFVAGFSTRHLWNILDQSVRKLFGDDAGKRTFIEENVEELRRSIKNG